MLQHQVIRTGKLNDSKGVMIVAHNSLKPQDGGQISAQKFLVSFFSPDVHLRQSVNSRTPLRRGLIVTAAVLLKVGSHGN